MIKPDKRPLPTFWEHLNIKVRIDSLLFDILLDSTFVPGQLENDQKSHEHSVFELHSIVSGSALLIIGDNEYKMNPGSLHLIGPNVFHSIKPAKEESFVRLTIRFRYQNLNPHDSWFPRNETERIEEALSHVNYCRFLDTDSTVEINGLIEEIRTEIEEPSFGTYISVQSLSALMIVHLVRLILPKSENMEAYSFPNKINDELRTRIIDIFFNNYRDNLTIEMLAEQLNLSAKQVNRTLQQHYRTSFKQKLLDTRVEVAKELLRTGSLTIQQIAEEVGYRTAPHFNRIFMQRIGVRPSHYRKMFESGDKKHDQ